jgi:hypothetical protein
MTYTGVIPDCDRVTLKDMIAEDVREFCGGARTACFRGTVVGGAMRELVCQKSM